MIKKLVKLKKNALTQGLTEHFSYLLPDISWKVVLIAIMEEVLSVEIIEDTLILHFSEGRTLTATPGVEDEIYQEWPQSFQQIVKQHEHLVFPDDGWGLSLGMSHNFEPDVSVGEAREYYEKEVSLFAPITNYSDWMVYHPEEKTVTGGDILCEFDHGVCDFGKHITYDVGALFLILLSEHLDLTLSFPATPKIKVIDDSAHQKWWEALSPAWKDHLRKEFDLDEEDMPSSKKIGKLEELSIWDDNILDPEPILKFPSLKKLYISETSITDFAFLEKINNLEKLDLSKRNISDLDPLKNLTKLKHLQLARTNISDISKLKNLTQLQDLCLYKTAISNIDALSNCTQLVDLTLSDTQIKDLSVLPQLENIYEISISRTKVTSLTPLYRFKNMKTLRMQGTPIDLKEILSFLNAVPSCRLVCDYYEDPESAKVALLKLKSITDFEQGYAFFTFEILGSLFVKDWIPKIEAYKLLASFVSFLPFSIKSNLQQKLLLLSLNILESIHAEYKEIDTKEVEEKVLEHLLACDNIA